MTRVLPLPAPARINTGPSVVSTASRCCGFSWSRKDNAEVAPESLLQFYRGIAVGGICTCNFRLRVSRKRAAHNFSECGQCEFWPQAARALSFFLRSRDGRRTRRAGEERL